jgi:hypothetical protein
MKKYKYRIAQTLNVFNITLRVIVFSIMTIISTPIILVDLVLLVIVLFLDDINTKASAKFRSSGRVDKNKE